jgi:hypothetical protein
MPTDWRISDAQKAVARDKFAATGSIGEAAAAAGVAWSSARILLEHEYDARAPAVGWHVLSDEEFAEAQERRGQGWSYQAIGEQYGVTRQAVAKRLRGQAARAAPPAGPK